MRPYQQPEAHRAGGSAFGAVRLAVLTVPADAAHVALVRRSALHVASLVGLDASRIGDFRLAVGEACGQFLHDARPARASAVEVRFERAHGTLRVTLRGPVPAAWPEPERLGWQLMSALVGDLCWGRSGGVGTLTLIEALPAADESARSPR